MFFDPAGKAKAHLHPGKIHDVEERHIIEQAMIEEIEGLADGTYTSNCVTQEEVIDLQHEDELLNRMVTEDEDEKKKKKVGLGLGKDKHARFGGKNKI